MNYVLYYNTICPFSRKVSFILDEFNIKYNKIDVKIWKLDENFLSISPSNETPVLIDLDNDYIVNDSYVILDYLDDVNDNIFSNYNYFGNNIFERTEVQRLQMWFDKKFFFDITKILMEEIFYKTFRSNNEVPNFKSIETIKYNLDLHIKYMENLLISRKWLACEKFTVADVSAFSHLSILDYMGYVSWNKYPKLKNWYLIIKSKKGFEKIIEERIGAFNPSINYDKYDF